MHGTSHRFVQGGGGETVMQVTSPRDIQSAFAAPEAQRISMLLRPKISLTCALAEASRVFIETYNNPLPPSDADRKQKKIFWRILSSSVYCYNLKNITPLETFKFHDVGIFQGLKFRI